MQFYVSPGGAPQQALYVMPPNTQTTSDAVTTPCGGGQEKKYKSTKFVALSSSAYSRKTHEQTAGQEEESFDLDQYLSFGTLN